MKPCNKPMGTFDLIAKSASSVQKIHLLVSLFGFPINPWFNSVPGTSFDTSAVSFASRSALEEFERMVLSFLINI